VIELRDVAKVHRRGETEVHALRGVTASIPEGSFTFILGPSGSGKSTLLYLMGALDAPSSGDIVVDGRSLGEMSLSAKDAYRRDEVGFIFQSFTLLKNLNAVDTALGPYLPRGVNGGLRNRAKELLERVGLGQRIDHTPNQLSGGEQQRVAIARALLKDPKLILADEPTGELDSRTGAEVFGYLRELHAEQKTTVVVVTHDQSHLAEGDTILRMRDGRIEE